MNQLPLILVLLLIGAGTYLRFEQPKHWNGYLDLLKAPEDKAAESANPLTVKAPGAEYITPESTIAIKSPHIVDVPQPSQPDQSSNTNQTVSTPPANKIFVPPNPLPSQSNWTWATSDGKIYKNVVVQKVEADRVTIDHDQGNPVLDITTLSSDVQKQLNFDPDLAAQATAARANINAPSSP